MGVNFQDLSLGRWVLQRSNQDEKDSAANGSDFRGGFTSEESAAERALRVAVRRRDKPTGKEALCRSVAGGLNGVGVVLFDVRLFFISSWSWVSNIILLFILDRAIYDHRLNCFFKV